MSILYTRVACAEAQQAQGNGKGQAKEAEGRQGRQGRQRASMPKRASGLVI